MVHVLLSVVVIGGIFLLMTNENRYSYIPGPWKESQKLWAASPKTSRTLGGADLLLPGGTMEVEGNGRTRN
jgi:hypothetical protein